MFKKSIVLLMAMFAVVFGASEVSAAKITKKQAKAFFELFVLSAVDVEFHSSLRDTKGFDSSDCWKGFNDDWDEFKIKEIEYDEEDDFSIVSGHFYEDGEMDEWQYAFVLVKEEKSWVISAVLRTFDDGETVYAYNFEKAKYEKMKE